MQRDATWNTLTAHAAEMAHDGSEKNRSDHEHCCIRPSITDVGVVLGMRRYLSTPGSLVGVKFAVVPAYGHSSVRPRQKKNGPE